MLTFQQNRNRIQTLRNSLTLPTLSTSRLSFASHCALAVGAPFGVWLENNLNVGAIGVVSVVVALGGFLWASAIGAIPIRPGKDLAFRQVLGKVFPYGLSLALGGVGFGTIASF